MSPDSTEEHHAWRCLFYGDVYEIPDAKPGQVEEQKEGEWALANPKASKGCYYRKLNEGESEVTVDIMGEWILHEPKLNPRYRWTCLSRPTRAGYPGLVHARLALAGGKLEESRAGRFCKVIDWLEAWHDRRLQIGQMEG